MTNLIEFRLHHEVEKDILYWSTKYTYGTASKQAAEIDIMGKIADRTKVNGYLSFEDFLKVCAWKTDRSKSKCDKNSQSLVEDATRIALSTPHEELRIGSLRVLKGVDWPTASVILHFFHQDPYPILDVRALETLGISSSKFILYNFRFWISYVEFCRDIAINHHVDMRTLDKALWGHSAYLAKQRRGKLV